MIGEFRTLFVYGTLRPGGRHWRQISDFIEHYDPAMITGHDLWHLDDGYPAAMPGSGVVFGDLLYIRSGQEASLFAIADEIERFSEDDEGSLYLRTGVRVARLRNTNGPAVPAAVYLFNPAHRPFLLLHGSELQDGEWPASRADESE